jgi:small subunit ribosomal protein S21
VTDSTGVLLDIFIQKKKAEKKFMTSVVLRPNESQDSLLKRFKKKVIKSGMLTTIRTKRWFVSKSEARRIEKKKSIQRIRRRKRVEERQ